MTELPKLNGTPENHQPLAVSASEAARLVGIGRTSLYEAISSGALRSLKVGKRRLITIEALKEFLAQREQNSYEDVG